MEGFNCAKFTEISIQNFTLTNNKLINDFDKNIVEIN